MSDKILASVKPAARKAKPVAKKASTKPTARAVTHVVKKAFPSPGGKAYSNVSTGVLKRKGLIEQAAKSVTMPGQKTHPVGTTLDRPEAVRKVNRAECISRFMQAYRTSASEQHAKVLQGIPTQALTELSAVLDIPFLDIVRGLRLGSSTIRRRQANKEPLALDESERTLGLIRLIGQIQDMVERAGDPTGFDAGIWTRDWLLNPSPALGGVLPFTYLSSSMGQQALSDLLMRNLTGAYS